jgi:hypothetical protein
LFREATHWMSLERSLFLEAQHGPSEATWCFGRESGRLGDMADEDPPYKCTSWVCQVSVVMHWISNSDCFFRPWPHIFGHRHCLVSLSLRAVPTTFLCGASSRP